MIITLIFVFLIIVGIVLVFMIGYMQNYSDGLDIAALALALVGIIGTFISIVIIISAHIGVDNLIKMNEIEYDSLCKRIEIIQSDYEDVSKSDVIKDISEWNKSVESIKYWSYSPWTNWFNSKKVADALKEIDYHGHGKE